MQNWMKTLSEHYESFRVSFPNEKLLVAFDIDGTILDMRHIICHALRSFDAINGTKYFTALEWKDIDFHEEQIDVIFEKRNIPEIHCQAIRNQYWNLLLSAATTIEAHCPFQGVLDVIRWFQLQPNTFVGLNTGRPESLRQGTLGSINELAGRFNVKFSSDLLFMRPDDWKLGIAAIKPEGIRYFQQKGYRVFAFVDNEPENLHAVSVMDRNKEILLLHADTIFKSTQTVIPERAVRGRHYNVSHLTSDKTLPQHVQLVWRCTYERESFAAFAGSNIHWLEINLDEILKQKNKDKRTLSLHESLNFAIASGKSIKLDLCQDVSVFEKALEIAAKYGFAGEALWFKLRDSHVLSGNCLRKIGTKYPEAIIEYNVDFLAKSILDEPDSAKEILTLLKKAGINRYSLTRGKPAWRRITVDLINWGFDVHINSVTTFENFLQTALLTPRSMTLCFGFDSWQYFGSLRGDQDEEANLLKLIA